MTEVLRPVGLCISSLSFVLSTSPMTPRVSNAYRERSSHVKELKIRLGACQARSACWEGHWRMSSLQDRNNESLELIKNIEELSVTIVHRIDESLASEASKKAWRKVKSKFRKTIFMVPVGFTAESCDARWYELWPKVDLDAWITRLERIVAVVDDLLEHDFDERTAGHFNTRSAQDGELEKLDRFSSSLYKLGSELYSRCTTEPSTYGWAIGLKPPRPNCDISRWSCAPPIDIELRFSVDRNSENHEHFRMHVVYEEDNSATDTLKEALDQVSKARDSSNNTHDWQGRLTRLYRHGNRIEHEFSVGDLLESNSIFSSDNAWRIDRASLIFSTSEWSLLLWNTPWLGRFCCHGVLLDLQVHDEACAHHVFESKMHVGCRLGAENHKFRNLGIAWAQLALGLPIRPASENDLINFEIFYDEKWQSIGRAGINERIIMTTGSRPLQEAIRFCLKPDSALLNRPFQPGFLLKCISTMHEP
ncbi:hypothetical protein IQ06DRAFT_247711 [Phaeosphaeriaceae sp. SRC1lsM3a]|nr:hypothetical protein IQ06DRAFT_247711 [Stagonospora sp. SRC1lsM3a]